MKKYIIGLIAGAFLAVLPLGIGEKSVEQNILNAQKTPVIKFGDPMPIDMFIELAKLINPSVVNISTTQKMNRRQRMGINPNDPFFDFFEQFMGPGMDMAPIPAQSLGTGFVIESD